MDFVVLSKVGGILKPFAAVFGQIFEWLYDLLSLIGIENVAVAVVLFTIVAKLLMTPLTIKQQKFSKLSNKMNPELTAIQEKYKGKKDERSLRLQQMETQAVYEKYGTSPTAGCLPMLITLPIMFALYRVIYAIPAYVSKIKDMFVVVINHMKATGFTTFTEMSDKAFEAIGVKAGADLSGYTETQMIDLMTKFRVENWNSLAEQFPQMSEKIEEIKSIYAVGSYNILDTPLEYGFSWAILIPVLAVVTQLLQSKISMSGQKKKDLDDNPMAKSMNSMMYTMPFVSGFMCLMFPLCIGIYWITSTVVTMVYQFFINRHIDHMDLNEMIQKNVEKQNKKREKLGIEYGSKMAELAKTQTKSIDAENVYRSRGSAASYANSTGKNYSAKDASDSNTETKANVESKSISGYANMLKRD